MTSQFFERCRRTARPGAVVVLGRRRVHEPWPDASREVREPWKGCLVLRDDMFGRRALHQPDDVQQRRERSPLVSQWADESKRTSLTLWGAERRGRRTPVRIGRGVVQSADRGLHGSPVAHPARLQRGQQNVILPVPCRHELSESVELAVGDNGCWRAGREEPTARNVGRGPTLRLRRLGRPPPLPRASSRYGNLPRQVGEPGPMRDQVLRQARLP